jgi:hypothetical protein
MRLLFHSNPTIQYDSSSPSRQEKVQPSNGNAIYPLYKLTCFFQSATHGILPHVLAGSLIYKNIFAFCIEFSEICAIFL